MFCSCARDTWHARGDLLFFFLIPKQPVDQICDKFALIDSAHVCCISPRAVGSSSLLGTRIDKLLLPCCCDLNHLQCWLNFWLAQMMTSFWSRTHHMSNMDDITYHNVTPAAVSYYQQCDYFCTEVHCYESCCIITTTDILRSLQIKIEKYMTKDLRFDLCTITFRYTALLLDQPFQSQITHEQWDPATVEALTWDMINLNERYMYTKIFLRIVGWPRYQHVAYRFEDGRLRCPRVARPGSAKNETTSQRLIIWKMHLFEWAQCQEAIGGIYFTKKWRAETLQSGLEFDNFKPRLESGIFDCIFWLNGSFLGMMMGVFWKRESRPI
jgi:hypothetical protein